jgi:hypothetical protein
MAVVQRCKIGRWPVERCKSEKGAKRGTGDRKVSAKQRGMGDGAARVGGW